MLEEVTGKRRHRHPLNTHADVTKSLASVIRKLRTLNVVDVDLDPIRINQAKALVYALRTLSQLMATQGLVEVSDEALAAEVIRRRDARLTRLGGTPFQLESEH